MNTNLFNKKYKWVILSFNISAILMILKFYAFYKTNSLSIYSDAVESIANVLATAFLIYSIYYSSLPRDVNHPYGHGKIEFISTGFEGGLIFLSGIYVIIEAYISYLGKTKIININQGIYLTLISMVVNLGYGYFLQLIGKKNKSIAIEADGKHLFGDGLTSLVIIVGMFLVEKTGALIIDVVLALLLSFYLLFNGYKLIRRALGGLLDEIDEGIVKEIVNNLSENRRASWIDLHNLRVIQYGSDFHLDCHLTLPYYLTLEQSHEEVRLFEEAIRNITTKNSEIFTHSDPCIEQSCPICQLVDCKVRKLSFVKRKEWNLINTTFDKKHEI